MAGHRKFKDLVAKMLPERQAHIKIEADELASLNDSFPDGMCDCNGEPCTGAIASLRDGLCEAGRTPCEGKEERVAPVC